MSKINRGQIPSDLAWLVDTLDDYERRLRILETPSGEALSSTVAKLTALVDDIQAQLDTWTASRWTNAQITTQINNSIASVLGGNVTIGGQFYCADAYGFDITYTRRTAWLGNDGRLGFASSSREKKTNIAPADSAELGALLDIEPKTFEYTAQHAWADEHPGYVVPTETGLIAEELDEAGLSAFVIYDEDGHAEGIEYGMLTVALLAIARTQRDDIADIRDRLDALEG